MQQYYHDVREKIGSASTYTVKLTPDATEFFGDMALAHGNCDETLTSGKGDPVTWQSKWTAVLQKADGQWRTARLHASMDPIDNPLAAMKAGATKWTFAAGGLITGSLLMAIFLRWKTKA